jgi:hypothetical protein
MRRHNPPPVYPLAPVLLALIAVSVLWVSYWGPDIGYSVSAFGVFAIPVVVRLRNSRFGVRYPPPVQAVKMNTIVLSGLVKRRVERTHEALRKMVLDLESLDATILQFDPDYRVETIKAKTFRPPKGLEQPGPDVPHLG